MSAYQNKSDHLSGEMLAYFEEIWRTNPEHLQKERTKRIIETLLSKYEGSELYVAYYQAIGLLSKDKNGFRRVVRSLKPWHGWTGAAESGVKRYRSRPPFNAEYILYLFLQKEDRDVVIGDLTEEYGKILERFNKRRADVWYYKQVFGSLWPLLRRAVLRIGALVWLGRILRRLIS
jgi:hypothetical protein